MCRAPSRIREIVFSSSTLAISRNIQQASIRSGDYHSCFLEVFALVNERNRGLARTFDDFRRSNATLLLAGMMEERLLSEEEFSQFGPETRDGISATRLLHERPATSAVPVVAVTAHCGDSEWRDRALEAGCVECVGKPLDFSKLEELIDRVSGG